MVVIMQNSQEKAGSDHAEFTRKRQKMKVSNTQNKED